MMSRFENSGELFRVRDRLVGCDENMELRSRCTRCLLRVVKFVSLDNIACFGFPIERANPKLWGPSFELPDPIGDRGIRDDDQCRTRLILLDQNTKRRDNLYCLALPQRISILV